MLNSMLMNMYATNLAYGSANTMFGANQARMGLANTVTGTESPRRIVALADQDKALQFAGLNAQTNYLVSQQLQANADALRKSERELQQRLIQAGTTFV